MKQIRSIYLFGASLLALLLCACDRSGPPQSDSGVRMAHVDISPDPQTGLTAEQQTVGKRLQVDYQPGAIKHLYIIAPRSGQVILYSTVQGKVASSGKRLTPRTVPAQIGTGDSKRNEGFAISINGVACTTLEVLQDEGTYGSSAPYIYWFDQRWRLSPTFLYRRSNHQSQRSADSGKEHHPQSRAESAGSKLITKILQCFDSSFAQFSSLCSSPCFCQNLTAAWRFTANPGPTRFSGQRFSPWCHQWSPGPWRSF